MSSDLCWELVRNNNKYYQKRGGIRMSNDPFNNSGKYTKRHAGFLQTKAAVVRLQKEKDVVVYVKDGSNTNKPAKQWVKKPVAGNKSGAASAAVAAVRPDLADSAFRRAKKLSITASRIQKVRANRKAHTAKVGRTFKRCHKREKKAKKN